MTALATIRKWAKQLKGQLLTLWFSRNHPDTPPAAKLMAGCVVAYAFSPIDLIPDFIPVLGYLDDVIIVPLGIWCTLRLLPAHVIAESRQRADAWMAARQAKPRNYFAAALIVVLWLCLAAGLWHWFRA